MRGGTVRLSSRGLRRMARKIFTKLPGKFSHPMPNILIERLDDVGNTFPRHWRIMRIRICPKCRAGLGIRQLKLNRKARDYFRRVYFIESGEMPAQNVLALQI